MKETPASYIYGSINPEKNEQSELQDTSEVLENGGRKRRVASVSLVLAAALLYMAVVVCPRFFQQQSSSELLKATIRSKSTISLGKPRESAFQVPFPHVDRSEYGTNPVPASSIIDPMLFSSELRGEGPSLLKVPFPTGAFWTNLVIQPTADQQYSYPIMVYPYGYKWNPTKLQVSYPSSRRLMDSVSIRDIFNPDLTLSTVEPITTRQIQAFDPLSVTLRFSSGSASESSYWETYLVQGSPFITLRYEQVTPVLQPISIFQGISCLDDDDDESVCQTERSDETSVKLHGTQFVMKTRENWSWLVFTSEPLTLVFDNLRKTTVSTDKPFSGILRLALVPPPQKDLTEYSSQFPEFYDCIDDLSKSSGVQALVEHAQVYPTGADVSWDFVSKHNAQLTFEFHTESMTQKDPSKLLMLALPHHTDLMAGSSSTTTKFVKDFDLTYRTIKGHMAAVIGSTWTYNEELTSIEFDDDASNLDANTKKIILDQVAFDVTRVLPVLDENVYGYGKQVARLAQLVHIARVLTKNGDDSSYNTLIEDATNTLHKFVTAFLSGNNQDIVVYDVNFGGLVTKDGLNDFMGDFGNGWYNDHHFHYGYHLYASAILGRWNDTFVDEYGSKVDALMYDVAHSTFGSSEETDAVDGAFFPLSRHKSWFDSHSFASGLFPFASGKSMESSSESINCYYGAYLWSTVKKNYSRERIDEDQWNFARLLLAMEIRGVKTYWHMSPQYQGDPSYDSRLYNPIFARNLMVGNLGMMDVTVSTWFGNNPLYVHMINFMPVTAITRELFDFEYVEKEFSDVIQPIYDGVEMAWKGYVVCDRAMVDPHAAWKDALELRSYELDQALSQAQVLYFTSTIDGFDPAKVGSGNYETTDDKSSSEGSSSSAYCYDHPACAALSLTGLCCPAPNGSNLLCCNESPPSPTSKKGESQSTSAVSASCSDHQACAALGLTGSCCPPPGGENLLCCNEDSASASLTQPAPQEGDKQSTSQSSSDSASCLNHQGCAALGLTGACCPTPDGSNLSCCEE